MRICHVASECSPFAKVGGLGDVVAGLSKEQVRQGHSVEVCLPRYDCLEHADSLSLEGELSSDFRGEWFTSRIYSDDLGGAKMRFFHLGHRYRFFDRETFYGCHDDLSRFLVFSKAVCEWLYKRSDRPDVIHLHDWQTAACAPLLEFVYKPLGFTGTRIILTIHNLEHQGRGPWELISDVGLAGAGLMQDGREPRNCNVLKGGILCADSITTVSPTYRDEALTALGGRGLDGVLREREQRFVGILNGLDEEVWNPKTDTTIPHNYSSRGLSGKTKCKLALKKRLGLEAGEQPLVASVTRLVHQKGVELLERAIWRTLELGGQFVLLGSSPERRISSQFEAIAEQLGDNPNAAVLLKNDEALAHEIYAGCDMLVVPSLFEPCGLTQLIACRYGSLPIVRQTGGLADTVNDIDWGSGPQKDRNGFVFEHPDVQGLDSALDRAVGRYHEDLKEWQKLQRRVMKLPFAWEKPAKEYLKLYEAASPKVPGMV